MENLNANIIIDNLKGSILSVKDLSNLRKINKEWNGTIKNFKYIKLIFLDKFKRFNDIELLQNSDVDILELERILINMESMSNRKYGIKYGHLFKQKLIYRKSNEKINIENTCKILKNIFKYAIILMDEQTISSTDIAKYPALWLSDYLHDIFKKEYPKVKFVIKIAKLFKFKYNYSMFMGDPINSYEFYKAFIFSKNIILYSYKEYDIKRDDFHFNMNLWIYIFRYYDSNNQMNSLEKVCILTQVIQYCYNSLIKLLPNTFEEKLISTIKGKAHEFHIQTLNSKCFYKKKLNEESLKIIELEI
jgi:hypothetical protein